MLSFCEPGKMSLEIMAFVLIKEKLSEEEWPFLCVAFSGPRQNHESPF